MKRTLLLVVVLALVVFSSIDDPTVTQATGGVPSDCSGTLTQTDIENMAEFFMADNDTDTNWTSCTDTISAYNADLLADYLEGINYAPTFVPDPSPTPTGGGLFGGGQKDTSTSRQEDAFNSGDEVRYIYPHKNRQIAGLLEFNCSSLPCWKQAVEKGDYGSCPNGFDCVSSPQCYETTDYCDVDDNDVDFVCKYTTNYNVSDPDSARIYGYGSNKIKALLALINSLSTDGATDSTCVHVCIANRVANLGMGTVKAKMRFRHDP